MSEARESIRLSKVARELNVGISSIVEFLTEKGIQIDANPNTKVNGEVYDILVEAYQDEIEDKEQSKLASVIREKRESITIEDNKPASRRRDQQEEIVIKDTQNVSDFTIRAKPEKNVNVNVVGKIELEQPPTPPAKKEKAEPKVEKPVEKAAPAPEPEPAPEARPEIEMIKTKSQKLSGPTVVGKIVLPAKEVRKERSSDDSKKKKRKRINKVIVDTDASANRPSQAGGDSRGGARKPGYKGAPARARKADLSPDEVQKEIKETLARLSGSGKSKSSKLRRAKRDAVSQRIEEAEAQKELDKSVLKVTEFVTVSELASMMNVASTAVISACMSLGIFASINQRLDAETLSIIAEEFGFEVEFVSAEVQESIVTEEDDPADLVERPPIITVMGHVDHGKTSLLDYIRKANVIAGEAGGITQHIGAYTVTMDSGKKLTFLDTPGHEAFTAMRARGAQVTDLVIIVIAADDNVMPQTKEAINHAQAAGVPMVFAINKIDKDGANPERIKEELSKMDILVEDWGGKFQSQEVSAKKGLNVAELLEKVILESELLELKANPNRNGSGVVIESALDKGKGFITTVLVENGTLKIGDVILAGQYSGRVKAMHDERGHEVPEAGPSTPVKVLGLDGACTAGDKFNVMNDDREARLIATKRLQLQREQGIRTQKHITLDEIGRRLAIGNFRELNIIVKGDVDGSIEALSDSLMKLSTEKVQVNIIHKAVGQITESDVLLASASDAIIIGFQVRPSVSARKLAETEAIDIRLYSVIYSAIEEIRSAMEGLLAPIIKEKILGSAEVREAFKITKVGTIAGCFVLEGKLIRNSKVRAIRDGVVIYSGNLGSLKRFKDDAKEVQHGYECGLNIDNFNDIKVGDIIEAFEEVEVKATLDS